MRNLLSVLILLPLTAIADQQFVSKPGRVTTVELFTSEGCSSCPPAEQWLARYVDHEGLWRDIIPMAFHVDYWDYLGWQDPWASDQHSQRQRRYASEGDLSRVYTPGIVVSGKEYRGYFRRSTRADPVPEATGTPGPLSLTLDKDTASVRFAGAGELTAHLAWLGLDIHQRIRRGENAGKTLTHQFVVLKHAQQATRHADGTWIFEAVQPPAEADAVIAWVSAPGSPAPLQATGGLLSQKAGR